MPAVNVPSKAPGTSLSYITVGAILAVFAGTSYFFMSGDVHPVVGYIRTCAFLLGLILMAIGFGVGHIGRVARTAEEAPAPGATVPPAAARMNSAPASPVQSPNGMPPNEVAMYAMPNSNNTSQTS